MTLTGFSSKARRPQHRASRLGSFFGRDKRGGKLTPSFITAALVAAGLLLVVIVLQESSPRRPSVVERLEPANMAALLPAGAQPSPEGWMEIADVPQSSYLVGYAMGDGSAYAAYIKWDKAAGKYARVSVVLLTAGSARLHGLPAFKPLPLGDTAPDAVLAVAAGDGGDAQMVLVPRGNTYIIATKVDHAGNPGPAYFPVSGNGRTVAFQDVNADGFIDVVVTVTASASGSAKKKSPEKTVDVFAWDSDAFRYDKELSWTLTTSARVFPEPDVPASTP